MTRSTINSRSIEGIHSIDATGTVTAAGLTVDTDTLHIDSTNNRVGIGTSSPTRKIHLTTTDPTTVSATNVMLEGGTNGYGAGVAFGSRTSAGGTLVEMAKITADGEAAFNTTASTQDAGLRFFTTLDGSLSERMRITSGGNVGIGTSSPTGFSGYTSVDINNATNGAIIDLSQGNSMKGRLVATASTMAIETASSVPIIFQPAGTERLRIDSSGNVGIGTTSPSNYGRLAVMTPTATYGYFGIDNSVGGAGGVNIGSYYGTTKISYIDTVLENGTPSSEQSRLQFATISGGTLAERMRITSAGSVGIGTTSASSRLHLKGDAYTTLTLDGTAGGTIDFYRNGSRHAQIFTDNAGGDIIFRNNTTTERLRIDSSGNVGIGTTSISPYKLRVSDSVTGGAVYQRLENTGTTGSNNTTQYQLATNSNSLSISINEQYNYSQIAQAGNAINHYVDADNHIFRTKGGGYTTMTINSFGHVTKQYQPSWNTRSYAHNNASTGFTRVGSTDNGGIILFTTQVGNGVNNGRFTAPVTGTYWVHVNGSDASAGNAGLQIYKNGSNHLSSTAYLYSVSYNGTGVSAAIHLNANDYVEGRFVHFNSVNSALYDGSFSGFLIG